MEKTYREMTSGSNEFFKNLAHSKRLEQAVNVHKPSPNMRVLDYGCGDGAMFEVLDDIVPIDQLTGFDPYLLSQMDRSDIKTYSDPNSLLAENVGSFDMIFCVEVCEHLSLTSQHQLFKNLRRLGRDEAVFVFGVPIETGLPGFFKNLYRAIKGNRQNASISKAIRSLLSIPILRAEDPDGWIGSHVGFDIAHFRELLRYGGFEIINTKCLPWPTLGKSLNNEIYFVCRRNELYR